jgi:hypothetical protein
LLKIVLFGFRFLKRCFFGEDKSIPRDKTKIAWLENVLFFFEAHALFYS